MYFAHGINSLPRSSAFTPVYGTVTIQSRVYTTVTIGNQEWTVENLDEKFDFAPVKTKSNGLQTTPAMWYFNDSEDVNGLDGYVKRGGLYNYYAVAQIEAQKSTLLPSGWHIPTRNDFITLCTFFGDAPKSTHTELLALNGSLGTYNGRSYPFNNHGTNESGFAFATNGYWQSDKYNKTNHYYANLNTNGYLWTIDVDTGPQMYADNFAFSFNTTSSGYIYIESTSQSSGMNVRLVREVA
jgi:uncharacterized protein (TIGR02145 family)